MTFSTVLSLAAACFSLLLAVVNVIRRRPSLATWCFFAGMTALALDSLFTGLSLRATQPQAVAYWLTGAFVAKSCVPVVWLCFSLTYSRGGYHQVLPHWRIPLATLGLLPILVMLGVFGPLLHVVPLERPAGTLAVQFGSAGKVLSGILLVALVLIVTNLEQTFRAAVGTMRWRIKYVIVALAVIFGTHIFARSQAILFSGYDMGLSGIESGALLIGCVFLMRAYLRTGLAEIDVYPSLAVLRSSLTVLVVGAYLFVVGVLAQLVRRYGGAEIFQLQAWFVLLGLAGLVALLLSDRFRQRVHDFAVRHFGRAQHDSLEIWSRFSQQLANVQNQTSLCTVSVRIVSETFDVLSVTLWLLDEATDRLVPGGSTAGHPDDLSRHQSMVASGAVVTGLRSRSSPFDLEDLNEPWAEEWRRINPTTFPNGGHRWCVPLRAGELSLGALVLADRVNGAVYTIEELELLRCTGDQITSVLLNLQLANEVVQARELDAFRTMSAFFVHDLKNAAASLNLMLKNLPVHFDDPAFRQDALRAVGNTARRIDDMLSRLSALRQPDFRPVEADLNQLVNEALQKVGEMPSVELTAVLQPLPRMLADRQQIESVVTNLVLNARDAVSSGGRIEVRTEHQGGRVLLSVGDNGCGMSAAFLKESLFRPFQSTKTTGLGIGLFQSRSIVQAHGGSVRVESEPGKGTTFHVSFPTPSAAHGTR